MGTKFTKRQKNGLTWSLGSKRKTGRLTNRGMNATKVMQELKKPIVYHPCEMCGSIDGVWRNKVVCVCHDCWKQLKSDLHL